MMAVLLEASGRTLLLALLAGALLKVGRVRHAGFRHACWSIVLAAMLAKPLLVWLLPAVTVFSWPTAEAAAAVGAMETLIVNALPAISGTGLSAAMAVVGAVSLLLLLRTLIGYVLGRRLVRAARTIAPDSLAGAQPGVRYLESERVRVPLTLGWRRPAVLLPPGFRSWAPRKLQLVLDHEHEHIRRGDFAIGVLAAAGRSLYWFNPLSWWLERRLASLAEQAVDDVTAGDDRRYYARILVDLARETTAGRVRALAVAEPRGLETRIARLLDDNHRPGPQPGRAWLAAAAVLGVALTALLATASVRSAAAAIAVNPSSARPALQAAPQDDAEDEVVLIEEEEVFLVGAGATPPRIISRVEPRYTEEARAARYQGTVVLEAIVRRDGTLEVRRIVRSLGFGLDESAIEALRQWRFQPGTRNGEPVDVALNIEVNFNLPPDEEATAPVSSAQLFTTSR